MAVPFYKPSRFILRLNSDTRADYSSQILNNYFSVVPYNIHFYVRGILGFIKISWNSDFMSLCRTMVSFCTMLITYIACEYTVCTYTKTYTI